MTRLSPRHFVATTAGLAGASPDGATPSARRGVLNASASRGGGRPRLATAP
ncbi:MAG: hypothetical protein M3464_09625 [Chloroflexota bacterium]|nr:hypothetical protein [Chloroflexota bacterium]